MRSFRDQRISNDYGELLRLQRELNRGGRPKLEIQPVGSVDRYQVGNGQIGPITARLQSLFGRMVRGGHPGYADWCTPVYQGRKTPV